MKKSTNADTESDKYPHLLTDMPCGLDFFVGKSQDTIAQLISKQIQNASPDKEITDIPTIRMVGIEGE